MKLNHVNRALLLASSAVALSLASPMASAQQQPTTAPTSKAPMAQPTQPNTQAGQQDLQESLRALEQARDQLGSAQQTQVADARTQAQQALEKVETKLSSENSARDAMESIDAAKETLQRPQMDRQAATEALDRVIADVRAIQQQRADRSTEPAQRMGQTNQPTDIQVEQKSAEVSVQQPAPQVTVKQPAPQVTVQQPQPKVIVEQPQPKVTVDQAKPKVTVQQQGEPKVTVKQQERAEVIVEKPDEPRMTGRTETTDQTSSPPMAKENAKASDMAKDRQTTAQNETSPQPQSNLPTARTGETDDGQVAALGRQGLVGKELYSADNRSMGEVENVVMAQNDRVESVLIDVGGFLGIGARRVAIPISRIKLQGDRLTTTMTEAQAKELPAHTE